MRKSLRYFLITALLAVLSTNVFAEVTDVNSIEELKGKAAGTYKLHLSEKTMIYGAYNDTWAGVYFYLWDGQQGLRINGAYDGKLKELYDANPVGKAITGSVTAYFDPASYNGCTMICNTSMYPESSFDGVLGSELNVEPKQMTVSEIKEAANKDYSVDFAYVKVHGYLLYANYQKNMYDDNDDNFMVDNTAKIVDEGNFNTIYNNENGTFRGAMYVSRQTNRDGSVTIYLNGQIVSSDWFTSEGQREAPKVTLDANEDNTTFKDYPVADVTVKGLSFKKDVPAIINLPFSMKAQDVADNFGEGTKLYRLSGYSDESKLTDTEAVYALDEVDLTTSSSSAGAVYLIVPGKDVAEGTDLTFKSTAISSYVTAGSSYFTNWDTYESMYLKGTFSPMELDAKKDLVLDENGNLVAPTGKIKGFTGYFEAPEAVVAAGGVTVKYGDKSTSGIAENVAVKGNSKVKGVYTLAGQRVNGSAKAKGIYIIDGRKVVVK